MPADGLTKALPRRKHEKFVRAVGLRDIEEQLQLEEHMETFKDRIKEARRLDEGTEETPKAPKGR